jgi:hypothetical protein
MKYADDDGFISTETAPPLDGAKVEYKFYDYLDGESGVATYANERFYFDKPYAASAGQRSGGHHFSLGSHYGYWRYVDAPGKEKLDSGGDPDASTRHSRDETEDLILLAAHCLEHQSETIREKDEEIAELREDLTVADGYGASLELEIDELEASIKTLDARSAEKIQDRHRLNDIICGQRKAIASKEKDIQELEARLADSDKAAQLEKDGWISASERMPEDYGDNVEIMRDGSIRIGHAFSHVGGILSGWTISGPLENVSSVGTHWRTLWPEATQENLASLRKGTSDPVETVEVKLRDGTIHIAFLGTGSNPEWHIIGKECAFSKVGTAEECANVSTDGTYFRKLSPRK